MRVPSSCFNLPPWAFTLPYARTVSAHRTTRDGTVGPPTRPVAIPDDLIETSTRVARGVVNLPVHVRWSDPVRTYDLSDPRDRALVYEQVLTEGTEDDVRRFVDVDGLMDLWDQLILPAHVREAWSAWLAAHDLQAPC